ncbi:hypothetical protein E9934_04335 [Nocardioides caeni]|uniref:Flp pilus-assembly TadG-like N-terminal domain-containing protein n=1 Tax=Nocardioides caeni TaxID=574700 RepID=A0A4S8NLF9_9ACTN|nr:pilus assembly protein TadG-related protein [Nocardioides caeni]THV17708.1 hypothetical protein E9934_04335 [Nocardioides caeni]
MRHRRTAGERGTVTLFMTVMLAVLMVAGAFVVDLGLQRVARADLQAIADVVALDLSRELDGRSIATLASAMDAAAEESLERNSDIVGNEVPEISVELGDIEVDGDFAAMAAGAPTAVKVTASTEVPFAFAGVTGQESGAAARSAVADNLSTACFRLGTFVAAIRAGDSTVLAPLNDLLGVNLDLVAYRGLAVADLRLSQLTATSVIGSPEELLSGGITYAELVTAMIEALSRESASSNAVAIQALTRIASSQVTAAIGQIHLSNVLHVTPTDRAAMEVALSVLDIVGTARLADGQHFLGIPNIQAQVPGVGFQFTGGITLVSAAELACGRANSADAVADTAQLDGTVGIAFTNLPSLNVPPLGSLQTPKGGGTLSVVAGSGTGRLVAPPDVYCGSGSAGDPSTMSVDVQTGLASYRLRTNVTVAAEVRLTDLLGLGLTSVLTNLLGNILLLGNKISLEVEVDLVIGSQTSGGTTRADLAIPPNDVTPVSTGGSMNLDVNSIIPTVTAVKLNGKSAGLASVTAITNPILSTLVTTGKGFVEKTLTPLVDNINEKFIGPVARMIGLRLAGADVYGVGVTCGTPRLIG